MISSRTKLYAGIGVVLCVGGVSVCLLLWYLISEQSAALVEKSKEVAILRAQEQSMVALSRLVDSTAEERSELSGYVLSKQDVPDFITQVEQFVTEQGVLIETKKLQESKKDEESQFGVLVMDVHLQGGRAPLEHIYEMAESLPYHSYVSKMSLQRVSDPGTGGASWESDLTFHITLSDI